MHSSNGHAYYEGVVDFCVLCCTDSIDRKGICAWMVVNMVRDISVQPAVRQDGESADGRLFDRYFSFFSRIALDRRK